MLRVLRKILDFVLDNPLGKFVLGGVGILALVAGFAADQQRRGGAKVVAKVERNNVDVTRKADSAARKSRDAAAGGLRNPYYRRDD